MDNSDVKENIRIPSAAPRRNPGQSAHCAHGGPSKRKASPAETRNRKRTRVCEVADLCENRIRTRSKTREERGRQSSRPKQKRTGLHFNQSDEVSCSMLIDSSGLSEKIVCLHNTTRRSKVTDDGQQQGDETKCQEIEAQRAEFEAKYKRLNPLDRGGCGSVFAGYREEDRLPVAIKHIPQDKVLCRPLKVKGKKLPAEVAIMLKLADGRDESEGGSSPVILLDWYDLEEELILVLERPDPAVNLLTYIKVNGGSLKEEEAKTILKQLLDATLELQHRGIFHRDIKVENILIETGSSVPRVRIIDFGLSCIVRVRSTYKIFYGTFDYIPPEYYRSSTYWPGPTTVWQLGTVIFEMLHASVRFNTKRFLRKELKIRGDLSKDCDHFLQVCFKTAPMQRATMEELKQHPWLR